MAAHESQLVIDTLKSFASDDLEVSALRMLAFTALNDVRNAIRRRDYTGAQEATYALMHTLDALEQRDRSGR